MTEQKSILRSLTDQVSELFIKSKAKEFEAFEEQIRNESDVAGKNRLHVDRLADVKETHGAVIQSLAFAKDINFASSVYNYVAINGASFDCFSQAASRLHTADFLARHADKILELSAAAVADYEANYAKFQKANAATLKKLGLLNNPTAD